MCRNEGFRQFLQQELVNRIRKNPSYSLRAFASDANTSPATLSQIISAKRKLTDRTCLKIADALGLSPEKTQQLMGMRIMDELKTKRQIAEDSFNIIADWYHFAILELTQVDGFEADVHWVSRALGISVSEVRDAVDRLQRLNFLRVDQRGWTDILGDADNRGFEATNGAYRKMQKQILEKGISALEEIPFSERVQNSRTLVGSPEKLAEAKRKIGNVLEELGLLMKKPGANEEVYHLGISLYPVSHSRKLR